MMPAVEMRGCKKKKMKKKKKIKKKKMSARVSNVEGVKTLSHVSLRCFVKLHNPGRVLKGSPDRK